MRISSVVVLLRPYIHPSIHSNPHPHSHDVYTASLLAFCIRTHSTHHLYSHIHAFAERQPVYESKLIESI